MREPTAATPPPTSARPRGARPQIVSREKIGDYPPQEIDTIVRWITSDERLRTDDEIISEAIQELGFQKRGTKIVAAIERAIENLRR